MCNYSKENLCILFTKYDDDGDVSVSVSNEHADINEILERFQAFLYASGFTWVEEGSIYL